MVIPGNPKDFARDIAEGFFVFNQATCRQFSPEELRTIAQLLELVARELRAEQVPLENTAALQKKHLRLQRANTALTFIRGYAKRARLAL